LLDCPSGVHGARKERGTMKSKRRSTSAFVGAGLALATGLFACSGQSTTDESPSATSAPQTEAASPAAATTYSFQLSGGGLQVDYRQSALGPIVTYDDGVESLTFSGEQISTVGSPAGTMISIVTRSSIDSGSTTFSFLLPRVSVAVNATTPVSTQGISAIHRFSAIPGRETGQLDEYGIVPLQGTAVGSGLEGAAAQ
jgi:hypothetical protein